MAKEIKVTIRMNGRKSARIRRVNPPKKASPVKISPLKLLCSSPKKAFLNISPKIDNKCPVSPVRSPKIIQGRVTFLIILISSCLEQLLRFLLKLLIKNVNSSFEVNQPLPNLSNVVSKVKSRTSANQRPRDNIIVPQVIIQDTDLEPLTPLISDNIIIPEIKQEDTHLEPLTVEKETCLKFPENKTGNNLDQIILSEGLDLFEESSSSRSSSRRSNEITEHADKIEEERVSLSNISDIEDESSTLTLVSDPLPPPRESCELDCLPNLVNDPMLDRTTDNLAGENVTSRLSEKQIAEEKKEVKIVSVEDTISDCFSDQVLIEDVSDLHQPETIDPSRYVSYPSDLRPSHRLPQRLTSRRSTVFLQSSLCCCPGSRERRDSDSDNRGISWIFCCFRTK